LVDKNTLLKNLDYIHSTLENLDDRQYIVTLNRDTLTKEDVNALKLDLRSHVKASFTKEDRFLSIHYQES